MNGFTCRRAAATVAAAAVWVVVLAGVAAADGTRSLSLDSVGGAVPVADTPITLVVRLDEGGHPVSGARVTAAVTPTDVAVVPTTPIPAVNGSAPGEYQATVSFPAAGTWRVWLVADDGGQRTEAAFDVAVAPGSVVPAESGGSTHVMEGMPGMEGSHSMEDMPGMGSAGAVEPGGGDSHGGDTAAGTTGGDGHSGADGFAGGHAGGGEINWWVIGGFLAVIALGVVSAAGLKQHLRRRITMGALAAESACDV